MPSIELRNNTFDPIWVLALMVFPNDEDLRNAYYAIHVAEWELDRINEPELVELESGFVKELLNAADKKTVSDEAAEGTRTGVVAGAYLLSYYVMHSFPKVFQEPSARKAIHVTKEYARRSTYADGTSIPVGGTKIRECIKDFGSVMHLWAGLLLYESLAANDRFDIFSTPDELEAFLGVAGVLQDFGCEFEASRPRHGDRNKVLDESSLWSVTEDIVRFIPSWTDPPEWVVSSLADYRAPKSGI